jgi:polyhydroxybutyrate depolymerase
MKTKLFVFCALALCVIALVACAAPTPTATPVPPAPTPVPPTVTPVPPTTTPVPPTPTAASNVSAILTATAPQAQTSAPPAPTPSRTVERATIRVGDLDRNYLYYIPANLPRNAPLLFAFHGSSANAAYMRTATEYKFERLADQNGFVVVYPDGYQMSWNDCNKTATLPARTAKIDDVSFVRALIAKFKTDHSINPSRIFAMGWSNGGHFAYRLAFEIPDEIAAIAAVTANVPTDDTFDCRVSGKPMPVLIINGTSDSIVLYEGGRTRGGATVRSTQATAEYFVKLNGQTSPPKTTRLPHRDPSDPTSVDKTIWNDAGKPEVVLFTVNGGGHTMPIAKFSTVSIMGLQLGLATGDLDGPAEIWEFFARQGSVQATKAEDVLGVWLVIYSPNDRFPSAENHWEHTADGNRIATFTTGAMKGYTTTAKYWFENGLYKIQYPQGSSEPNSFAIGAYQVYVTKQDGKAVQLRFVAVDDQYVDRKNRMIYKPWTRVER